MGIESDRRTGRMIGVCDACRKEIKPNDNASAELSVPGESRQMRLYLLHADCREEFARFRALVQLDFWRSFSSPPAFAAFDQFPVKLPGHIKTILRDFKARVAQSIEEAKKEAK